MLLITLATLGVAWLAVVAIVVGVCASAARGDRALVGQRLVVNSDFSTAQMSEMGRARDQIWTPSMSPVKNRSQSALSLPS